MLNKILHRNVAAQYYQLLEQLAIAWMVILAKVVFEYQKQKNVIEAVLKAINTTDAIQYTLKAV